MKYKYVYCFAIKLKFIVVLQKIMHEEATSHITKSITSYNVSPKG